MQTENFRCLSAGFGKDRGAKDKIFKFPGSQRKQGNSQNTSYLCLIDYTKAFEFVGHNKLRKALKGMGIPPLEWPHGARATVR